jgi:hypothetical protein
MIRGVVLGRQGVQVDTATVRVVYGWAEAEALRDRLRADVPDSPTCPRLAAWADLQEELSACIIEWHRRLDAEHGQVTA